MRFIIAMVSPHSMLTHQHHHGLGSNALTGAGLTTIYVNGVTALGYTSGAQTFQGKSLTIAEWTNYL